MPATLRRYLDACLRSQLGASRLAAGELVGSDAAVAEDLNLMLAEASAEDAAGRADETVREDGDAESEKSRTRLKSNSRAMVSVSVRS